MHGGKKGPLENSTNICRGTHKATAKFTAHNGKAYPTAPPRPGAAPAIARGVSPLALAVDRRASITC